jgi:hypothetical protein
MNPFTIAIIEDNQSDFRRLHEQIRKDAPFVKKIYLCKFETDFYELSNWQDTDLIIADNEIGGRSDAGLNFLRNFNLKHQNLDIYSLIYTWGTQNYSEFLIKHHAFHQRHPRFLGMVFKQVGDTDKVREVLESIEMKQPHPIFDRPIPASSAFNRSQEQREFAEKMLDLKQRIFDPLVLLRQMVRWYLAQNGIVDFNLLVETYSATLMSRFDALLCDTREFLDFIEGFESVKNTGEFLSICDFVEALAGCVGHKHNRRRTRSLQLERLINLLSSGRALKSNGKQACRSTSNKVLRNRLHKVVRRCDDFASEILELSDKAGTRINANP